MTEHSISATCEVCGATLSPELGRGGVCPRCLAELAFEAPSLPTGLGRQDENVTLEQGAGTLSPGQILGKRYRIRSLLGGGGMGEVWQATDLKLRVDVALKALRQELLADRRALGTLRREVRAARGVISGGVCRVFDLVEVDGKELISMEYIDGATLLDVLRERAPLELAEAREIASQILAGLEAIHEAGLVHRDVKPENLMITRSGRVVLMDFGIAKALAGTSETVSGTPAYMSPEQARGETLDVRADVFAAGVVLAEMTAPLGLKGFEDRKAIWEGIRRQPPVLPDSPWAIVLRKAVAARREERYPTAAALARALEEVTLRVAGAEDSRPYPGLASFTEEDSGYFFGREFEVEAMWRRLQRSHLLGLIGPSGTGKSSFLRAGLLPVRPTGWSAVVMTPGRRPHSALARELVPELSADTEALQWLTAPDEPEALLGAVTKWRQQHGEALLIVDQFEELFTQNPPDHQERFAELLARFTLEADVHVLLAMRDDFLAFCSEHESLAPIFTHLTPLKPLAGGSIRRALVQPALKCGYRFEDEALVDEMLEEVKDERGALPLLAFAASRLWDHRAREEGVLTREAYEHIGGVAGALAQHAERTLESIGRSRVPIVRELFRNLVTAQGTRAVRDREDLLSVFGGSSDAAATAAKAGEVLDALIDARLVTSYEIPGAERDSGRSTQIEVIHESLLSNWPRLVRWQTQDADSAQLRDQIRQAAQMWEERGRPGDLLWTGTSFSEYRLWRERYSGGLTASEEEFANAMAVKAERRVRQRRTTIAGAFALLLVGLAVVGVFWRQSVAQARRAEANELLALGQLEIDTNPTGALAYSLASLERADGQVARLFALKALWRGPIAMILEGTPTNPSRGTASLHFSHDGRWLATGHREGKVKIWASNGGLPNQIGRQEKTVPHVRFGSRSDRLITRSWPSHAMQVWSIPDGQLVRTLPTKGPLDFRLAQGPRPLFTFTQQGDRTRVEAWSLDGGEPEVLGDLGGGLHEWSRFANPWNVEIDSAGSRLAYVPFGGGTTPGARSSSGEIYLASVKEDYTPRLVGSHSERVAGLAFHPGGQKLASADDAGEVRIWDLESESRTPERVLLHEPGLVRYLRFDPAGSKLAAASFAGHTAVWDLEGPSDADPLALGLPYWIGNLTFHPRGDWLATTSAFGVEMWPIRQRQSLVLRGHEGTVADVAFLPDGKSLASVGDDGTLRIWPLSTGEDGSGGVRFDLEDEWLDDIVLDPLGRRALVASSSGAIWLVPLDGEAPRQLWHFNTRKLTLALGQHAAAAAGGQDRKMPEKLRVWDLDSGETRTFAPGVGEIEQLGGFTPDGKLVVASESGIWIFDLQENRSERLSARPGQIDLTPNGRFLLAASQGDNGEARLFDLEEGTSLQLDSHGPSRSGWLDASGTIALTWPANHGFLRIGLVRGGPVHLLAKDDLGSIYRPALSPDGEWVALMSGAGGATIRLWPVPDTSQPPLDTLPHDELLRKLRTLTNLRVVTDPDAETGWSWGLDPFPGWENQPAL